MQIRKFEERYMAIRTQNSQAIPKISSPNLMDPLISFLKRNGGKDAKWGLTTKLVKEKGRLLKYLSDPNLIVVEVERRKEICGAENAWGKPMSAFVTIWPHYRFDCNSDILEETQGSKIPQLSIDYSALAEELSFDMSFEFERFEGGGWYCFESLFDEECHVLGLDDLEQFAQNITPDYSDNMKEISEYVDAKEAQAIVSKIREVVRQRILAKALEAWRKKEGDNS